MRERIAKHLAWREKSAALRAGGHVTCMESIVKFQGGRVYDLGGYSWGRNLLSFSEIRNILTSHMWDGFNPEGGRNA